MHKDKMKIIYEHGQMDVTNVLKKCNGDKNQAHFIIEKAIKRYIDSEIRITIETLATLGDSIRSLSITIEELLLTKETDLKNQLNLYELRSFLTINEVKEWQNFIAHQEATPTFDGNDVPF